AGTRLRDGRPRGRPAEQRVVADAGVVRVAADTGGDADGADPQDETDQLLHLARRPGCRLGLAAVLGFDADRPGAVGPAVRLQVRVRAPVERQELPRRTLEREDEVRLEIRVVAEE